MDLAALAVFRAVAREQSVTRAAALLGRAPSNVTTRIQQLEAEIGVSLFQRDRRCMLLTAEGEAYLDYAERILNLADEARQVVNPDRPAGVLRIGAMESAAASRLPRPLVRFNRLWPQVRLDLSTGPTRQLVDALLAHRLDGALITLIPGEAAPADEPLDTVPVFREELVLVLPPGHPPVSGPADIGPKVLAAFGHGCSYRALALDWLAGCGTAGRFAVHEVRSCHAMFACTAAGACVAVMPRSVVDLLRPLAAVETVPLATVETALASRPGFATPAFAAFRDLLLDYCESPDDAAQ